MKLNFRRTIKLAVTLIILLALFSCYRPGVSIPEPLENEPLVLKTYDAPEGYDDEVKRIINSLLVDRMSKKRYGQVSMTADGLLLVNAPKSFHPGVESFIFELKKREPMPPAPSIKVQYWIILGKRTDAASNASKFRELAPILETINKSQGPHKFVLQERLSTISQSNEEAEVTGATAHVRSHSSMSKDEVIMDLRIFSESSRIETRVQIPKGKLLVLGESSHELRNYYSFLKELGIEDKPGWKANKVVVSIFYIVRADVIG